MNTHTVRYEIQFFVLLLALWGLERCEGVWYVYRAMTCQVPLARRLFPVPSIYLHSLFPGLFCRPLHARGTRPSRRTLTGEIVIVIEKGPQ